MTRFCTSAVVLGLAWLLRASPVTSLAADYYVATSGNDGNPGSLTAPFRTLEAARDAIRRLRVSGRLSRGVTVWVRGGIHERASTFALTAQDSGAPGAPIVYCGYPGETARIIGGKVLQEFRPVTDPGVLSRLPGPARTNVVMVDLRANGIRNFGTLKPRGRNRGTIPAHLELFFGDYPMTLARWPNAGEWANIAGVPGPRAVPPQAGNLTNGFYYAGDRPGGWQPSTNIWVHGYWQHDWADTHERVATLDLANHLIRTAYPYGQYGFGTGQRYYFENILEELDEPGEYFTDTVNGRLYFWPPGPLANARVTASVLETPLLTLTGTSNCVVSNLTFEVTRGVGLRLDNTASNTLAGLAIQLTGGDAAQVAGGRGDWILGCTIIRTGDGGVEISGGDRATLAPGGHVVAGCYFSDQGRWDRCSYLPLKLHGVGNRAAHNLIENQPHQAIQFDGNDHVIEYNEIRRVARETGDAGAIYAGRDWTWRGNVIRFNYLHDISGPGLYGAVGVYMDDMMSGATIAGNVFARVQTGIHINGGRDHLIQNNIFVDCARSLWIGDEGLSPGWRGTVYGFLRAGLKAVPAPLYRSRYPAIADLDKYYARTNGVPPENNLVRLNIDVRDAQPFPSFHELLWRTPWTNYLAASSTPNFVGPSPGFVAPGDPALAGFQLRAGAAALAAGFAQVPFPRMGTNGYEPGQPLGSGVGGNSP